MLATMCPDIVFARLPVILTCGIVTALLGFILIKIEFHSHPLSVGSHAKKGIGYPMRVLISIVPSYTTNILTLREKVIAIIDNNGYVLAPLPVAPVHEADMVLLPEGWKALQRIAKLTGLVLEGAYPDGSASSGRTHGRTNSSGCCCVSSPSSVGTTG